MSLANNVSSVLENIKNNMEEELKNLFMEIEEKCMSRDIEVTLCAQTIITMKYNCKFHF